METGTLHVLVIRDEVQIGLGTLKLTVSLSKNDERTLLMTLSFFWRRYLHGDKRNKLRTVDIPE